MASNSKIWFFIFLVLEQSTIPKKFFGKLFIIQNPIPALLSLLIVLIELEFRSKIRCPWTAGSDIQQVPVAKTQCKTVNVAFRIRQWGTSIMQCGLNKSNKLFILVNILSNEPLVYRMLIICSDVTHPSNLVILPSDYPSLWSVTPSYSKEKVLIT